MIAKTRLWLASYLADVSYERAIMLGNILSSIYRLDSCSEHSDWIHINLFRGEFAEFDVSYERAIMLENILSWQAFTVSTPARNIPIEFILISSGVSSPFINR